jgi:hypothetical protein
VTINDSSDHAYHHLLSGLLIRGALIVHNVVSLGVIRVGLGLAHPR